MYSDRYLATHSLGGKSSKESSKEGLRTGAVEKIIGNGRLILISFCANCLRWSISVKREKSAIRDGFSLYLVLISCPLYVSVPFVFRVVFQYQHFFDLAVSVKQLLLIILLLLSLLMTLLEERSNLRSDDDRILEAETNITLRQDLREWFLFDQPILSL